MRLFITKRHFLSIIGEEGNYSCQVMELIHGMGMQPAEITDNQEDVVSGIVYSRDFVTNRTLKTLQEISEFHLECLVALT